MKTKKLFCRGAMRCARSGLVVVFAAAILILSGCTSTQYLGVVTPHNAVDVLGRNVQVFEGISYDEAVLLAGEAGYEVILSYEGRNTMALFGLSGKVRVIAKDADGVRPGVGVKR